MSRYRRLWWANGTGVLVLSIIMVISALSAVYSQIYLGKAWALLAQWGEFLGYAARHSVDPFRRWFLRFVQLALFLGPLSLCFGWVVMGRFLENIRAIRSIEQLQQRRLERTDSARKRHRQQAEAAEFTKLDSIARESTRKILAENYPEYIAGDDLVDDDAWDEELIADFLDPPEIVVQYPIQGTSVLGECLLYDRRRVEAAKSDRDYLKRIAEIQRQRWEEEAEERRYLAKVAREEEISRIEEEKRDERNRRQASQKIVYVS